MRRYSNIASPSSSSTGSTAHCGPWLLHQQPPGLTKLVEASHINVIYLSQWDQIGYPRPRCRFLNWYVLHDEVVSLMRHLLSGTLWVFLSGTHTPSPCSSHYSCRPAAAVLVCPEYFISPVPSTYIGVEHSPIRHLGRHSIGDRQLHTGNIHLIVKYL
jgi:hypothetical protein